MWSQTRASKWDIEIITSRPHQHKLFALVDLPLRFPTRTFWHRFSMIYWQNKTLKHHRKEEEEEERRWWWKAAELQRQNLVHGVEQVQITKVQEKPLEKEKKRKMKDLCYETNDVKKRADWAQYIYGEHERKPLKLIKKYRQTARCFCCKLFSWLYLLGITWAQPLDFFSSFLSCGFLKWLVFACPHSYKEGVEASTPAFRVNHEPQSQPVICAHACL
ncbi:hypothetical protein V6N11_063401 [Hibiscus sabdariffa]|uniref:Uncharacterized protein n=1 Tax=Hibiscus sabdariffa TaxID=183260 RepID=A0ABR1Z7N8_9ROSI